MLRAEDMVELQPRRGYVVAPLSRQDVVDVFALQGDVAGELAARVATVVTAEQIDELTAAQEGCAVPRTLGESPNRAPGVRVPPGAA